MLAQILSVSHVLCSLPFHTSSAISELFKYSLNSHLFVSHHEPSPAALYSLFCHLIPRRYLPPTDRLQELPGCLQADLSCLQGVTSEECSLSNSTGHIDLLLLNPRLTASHYLPIQVKTWFSHFPATTLSIQIPFPMVLPELFFNW